MFAIFNASRWKQWLKNARNPPKYLSASIIVSLGGLLNGLDSGTIGPVTTMPSFKASFGELSPLMHGLVISSILLTATSTSPFGGAISDSLGRTRSIATGALIFATGAALEAGAVTLGMFIGARCLAGLGEGVFLSNLVVYVCEIAPPRFRGPLAMTVQLFISAGLCIGYFTCYGTVNIASSLSWRFPLAMQSGISLFLALAAFFYLPQSPRWLSYKGRKEEASAAWDILGVSNAEREKDLLLDPAPAILVSQDAPDRELPIVVNAGVVAKMRLVMRETLPVFRRGPRKPMLMGVFVMAMQQLSGIDGVIYYAPLLFHQAGLSSSSASFLASGISAILIFVFTILAVYLSDRWGRRTSTIYGGLLLSICMSLMGALYATHSVHPTGSARWVIILTIYVFAITYSMTWAFGIKIFASEIQPAATRATATSLAQGANFMTNFFVALVTPILLAKSASGAYWLFGTAAMSTTVVCALLMPETRGRELEAVAEAFSIHKMADAPVVRGLRALGSRMGRLAGIKVNRTTNGSHDEIELHSRE